MTEQELREKIVEALEQGGKNFHESFHEELKKAFENGAKHFGSKDCKKTIYDFYADALIEKGMIFVDERTVILPIRMSGKTLIQKAQYYDQMKHRAEVAELALLNVYLEGTPWCNLEIAKINRNIQLARAEKELEGEKK